MSLPYEKLSDEQKLFVKKALGGENVLVDACIGSGKTTAIQALCEVLYEKYGNTKHVLYLTYNRLLKFDAQAKILTANAFVQNYHGFACCELHARGLPVSQNDCLSMYMANGIRSSGYDVLIIDEYQDINQSIADMLVAVKEANPKMQIVIVGDMSQKIYDTTSLDAAWFISSFIGTCCKLEFTRCFRLGSAYANWIGEIWDKKIVGVNEDCRVRKMSFEETYRFLSKQNPQDILCLGSNSPTGHRTQMLNKLEKYHPDKFNKDTVWSNVGNDSGDSSKESNDDFIKKAAIFTTYDGSKGMERDVCVIFNWTSWYWDSRSKKSGTKYEILRNIFCVAASRGKKDIIFCDYGSCGPSMLTQRQLMTPFRSNYKFSDVIISQMFDYKYTEHIDAAYRQLKVEEIRPSGDVINATLRDGNIDLSMCLGLIMEVGYFTHTDIDVYIKSWFEMNAHNQSRIIQGWEQWSTTYKVLYYTSLVTGQNRYLNQVSSLFTEDEWAQVVSRLRSELPMDCRSQVRCKLNLSSGPFCCFNAKGFCDIEYNDAIYELKFVSELARVHYLQLAMYLVATGTPYGYLWNVKDNHMVKVSVPNEGRFLDCVMTAVTKGLEDHVDYYGSELCDFYVSRVSVEDMDDGTRNRLFYYAMASGNSCVGHDGAKNGNSVPSPSIALGMAGKDGPVSSSGEAPGKVEKESVLSSSVVTESDLLSSDIRSNPSFYYGLASSMLDDYLSGFRVNLNTVLDYCVKNGYSLPCSGKIFLSEFSHALRKNKDCFSDVQVKKLEVFTERFDLVNKSKKRQKW